jgi:glycosyltransferase involved in cell wall biosynthesis
MTADPRGHLALAPEPLSFTAPASAWRFRLVSFPAELAPPARVAPVEVLVIVVGRNQQRLVREALLSVDAQDLDCPWGAVVVDDNSDDGTWAALDHFPYPAIRVDQRGGELASVIVGTDYAEHLGWLTDQTIICHLSMDDYLSGPDVLARLVEVYRDPDVWMTYGSYRDSSGAMGHCEPLPQAAHQLGDYRARPWVTSHLRSYRYGLWRRIPAEQLIDPETGKPWFYATDLAMVFPMLEMARERARFIPDVLYRYRLHDGNVSANLYAGPCERVRAMPRLDRLAHL